MEPNKNELHDIVPQSNILFNYYISLSFCVICVSLGHVKLNPLEFWNAAWYNIICQYNSSFNLWMRKLVICEYYTTTLLSALPSIVPKVSLFFFYVTLVYSNKVEKLAMFTTE